MKSRLALIGVTAAALMAPLGAVPVAAAELPGAPREVTWSDESGSSDVGTIYLNWRVPADDGGEAITSYEIQQTRNGEWIDLYTFRSVSGRLTLEIDGIPRGVTYRFRIAAVTAAGQGPWAESDDVRLRTRPGPPGDVRWQISPAGSLWVRWQAPADSGGPLPPNQQYFIPLLVSYTVWESTDGEYWIPVGTMRAQPPFLVTIDNYRVGDRKIYAVSARNERGDGPLSEPTSWFEPTLARPDPVSNLRMTFRKLPNGNAAARITWTPGNSGGSRQHFRISASVDGGMVLRNKRVDAARFTLANIPLTTHRGVPSRVVVTVYASNTRYLSVTPTVKEARIPLSLLGVRAGT